jgi:uncharacterized membrane protein YhfC
MEGGSGISPLLLVPSLGTIAVALAFIFGWKISERPPWSAFLWGLLAFLVAIVIKIVVTALASEPFIQWAMTSAPEPVGEILFWGYLVLLTPVAQSITLASMPGIIEVLVILVFTRIVARGRATWGQATFFGIGFASILPLVIGLSSAILPLRALFIPAAVQFEELYPLEMASSTPDLWLWVTPEVIERAAIIAGCIGLAALIFYATCSRKWVVYLAALAYALLLPAMFLWRSSASMSPDLTETWTARASLAFVGILGLVIAAVLQRWWPSEVDVEAVKEEPELASLFDRPLPPLDPFLAIDEVDGDSEASAETLPVEESVTTEDSGEEGKGDEAKPDTEVDTTTGNPVR